MNENTESVLILEDDAVCVENFAEMVAMFWRHLPEDWNFVYLGGQHLQENQRLPRKVNVYVYRPYNVNRTHCYGLRGREILKTVYEHLHEYRSWNVPHHIDHYLGELHKRTETGLYAPYEWLIAQSEGMSDINNRESKTRRFSGARDLVFPKIDRPGVAILGDYFGGGAEVAKILYSLGLHLGNEPEGCHFTDRQLVEICCRSYTQQWLTESLSYEDRVNHLRHWAGIQCSRQEAGDFCGWHPILSLMGPEIEEAWNHPKFIVVECSPEKSLENMIRLKEQWNHETLNRANTLLKQTRNRFLATSNSPVLRIDYDKLRAFPDSIIETICKFLEYAPTEEQRQNAIALVRASPVNSLMIS